MSRDLILDFLSRDARVCVPVAEIWPETGVPAVAVWSHLTWLAEAGMVEVWGSEDSFTVTLSAFAANRAGLRMSRDSERWLAPGERERATRRKESGTLTTTDFCMDPDDLADEQALAPDREAEIREEAEVHAPRRSGDYLTRPLQQPSRIHGSTAIWPVAGHRRDDGSWISGRKHIGPCGGCGNAPFTVADYCLVCQRSGQDHLIPKLPRPVAVPAKQAARFKAKGKAAKKAG